LLCFYAPLLGAFAFNVVTYALVRCSSQVRAILRRDSFSAQFSGAIR